MVKVTSLIAYGRRSGSTPPGETPEETEKRIVTDAVEGHETILLENFNDLKLASSQLNAIVSERPCRLRILGKSRTVLIESRLGRGDGQRRRAGS